MTVRLNKCFLFVGRRGTGKTTLAREMAEKMAKSSRRKIVIIDTDDHPSYADVEVITMEQLKTWNGTICRVIESNIDQVLMILNQYQSNCIVMCEDASKYITANISKAVRSFLIDMRKRNFDVIIMFHFLSDVPPYLCKQYDHMILFKTGDNLQVTQNKFANWHTIVKKLQRILKHKDYNYCETIAIDE